MQNLSQILSLSFSVFSKSPKELNLPGIFHLVLQPKSISINDFAALPSMPSQYATVSRYVKSSVDLFGLIKHI